MHKRFLSMMLAAAVLLAACGQAAPARPTTLTPGPGSSTAPLPAAPVPTEDPSTPKMACQVVSITPTQGSTEVSMFPPPGQADWILGKNPKAPLTITEYSDFQ